MKLLSVEEKLINLLTTIVWWFEVKWNKGAIFVFFFFCFFFPTISSFLLVFVWMIVISVASFSEIGVLIFKSVLLGLCIVGAPLFLVLIQFHHNGINVFKKTRQSPNQNRHNGWIWKVRFLIVFPLGPTFSLLWLANARQVVSVTELYADLILFFLNRTYALPHPTTSMR